MQLGGFKTAVQSNMTRFQVGEIHYSDQNKNTLLGGCAIWGCHHGMGQHNQIPGCITHILKYVSNATRNPAIPTHTAMAAPDYTST